ncbi:PPR10, partial [Symbiodinium natans]
AEAAEWSRALALLAQLGPSASLKSSASGLRADRLSFNAALTACRNAGRWGEMLAVLESMAAAKQVPDDSTLSTVTAACDRAGLPDLGLRLFLQLSREGASPAAPAYNAALKSASSVLLWREVLSLLSEMSTRDVARSRLACRALLRACAERPLYAAAALPAFRGVLSEAELRQLAEGLERQIHCGPAEPPSANFSLSVSWRSLPSVTPQELEGLVPNFRRHGADFQRRQLRKLRGLLVQVPGIQILDLVLEAKRPLLKLTLPCGTRADVSAQNREGCRKSAFIARHLQLGHPMLAKCCLYLKTWAQRPGSFYFVLSVFCCLQALGCHMFPIVKLYYTHASETVDE